MCTAGNTPATNTYVAGHVTGIVSDLAAGRVEGQGTPEVTARQARERSGRTATELAEELAAATPGVMALLESLPAHIWAGPSLGDPRYSMGFAVEALWYDAYVHADDIRSALGKPSDRGPGLRCAVHHVAGYLQERDWPPTTIAVDGIDPIDISGGGSRIVGDPLQFVLAATGRIDPTSVELDPDINVYA